MQVTELPRTESIVKAMQKCHLHSPECAAAQFSRKYFAEKFPENCLTENSVFLRQHIRLVSSVSFMLHPLLFS